MIAGATTSVRVAGRSDVDALIGLRRAWTVERQEVEDDPGFADRFRAWFDAEHPQRTFWLAELAGAPIGMVNLLVFTRMPGPSIDAGRWGYLGNMYVEPPHRNAGVGGRLVEALLAHADAEHLERVVLSPTKPSIAFYRRAGFEAADQLLLRPHR